MKKFIVFAGLLLCFSQVFAGGILTNGNQSAQYIRMLSRNASTSIDAVYFNPAGLMKMDNGFYIALQSQSLFQTKTIESGYPFLHTSKYDGTLTAPVFPNVYAVYKKDRIAFSLGIGPNSGGGSAAFDKGLPSFEKTISKLTPGLAGLSKIGKSVTDYNVDINFKGESVYWGIQGGVSYKLNDMISVYGGLRYLPSTTTYNGYLRNIEVKVNGVFKPANTFLSTEAAPVLQGLATQTAGAGASVQPLITAGAGALTLAQLQGANLITAAIKTQLEGGLAGLGLSAAQIGAMNVSQIQGAFVAGAASLNAQAASLVATSTQLSDKLVDVKQTGSGITPILGLNLTPCEGLNIGFKYEFMTKLKLTNSTAVDGTGMFPDKKVTNSDIPSLFSMGVDYKVGKKWNFSASYNLYHDSGVNWGTNSYGESRTIDKDGWEFAIGAQYQVCDKWALSAGYLHTVIGVSEQFQSDFSFYNPTAHTLGGGLEWKPCSKITVDLGALFTNYDDASKLFKDAEVGNYVETYKKHNVGYAIGLGYRFGSGK